MGPHDSTIKAASEAQKVLLRFDLDCDCRSSSEGFIWDAWPPVCREPGAPVLFELQQLLNHGGTRRRSIGEVSRDLDLTETSVREWVEQAKVDAGRGPEGALSTAEKEELRKLRREVRQLREDKEILKKAAAFFAKENE